MAHMYELLHIQQGRIRLKKLFEFYLLYHIEMAHGFWISCKLPRERVVAYTCMSHGTCEWVLSA